MKLPSFLRLDSYPIISRLLVTLLVLVIVIFCYLPADMKNPTYAGINFLMSAAALMFGGSLLGFLFGIPKEGLQVDLNGKLIENTNLEQVSDWLTKIIVGVGLVEFNHIKAMVDTTAINLNQSMGKPGLALAYGTLLTFSLAGFLIGYIWTRTEFPLLLIHMKRSKSLIEIENENLKKEKNFFEEKAESLKKSVQVKTKDITKDLVNESTVMHNIEFLSEFEQGNESEGVKSLIEKLKAGVDEAIQKKKFDKVPDDLQKGMWGGKSEKNGYRLSATVADAAHAAGLFQVRVSLLADGAGSNNLPVAFFVHDSFNVERNVLVVNPETDQTPLLELIAYEAFTLGALLPDGTELELDLNDLPGFPKGFYWEANEKNGLLGPA